LTHRVQRREKVVAKLDGHRVQHLGTVHGDDRDVVVRLVDADGGHEPPLARARYHHDMDPFLQDAPQASNRFRADTTLRNSLERILPPDVFAEASPQFDEMGERVVRELRALANLAEANPPKHIPLDAWGKRVDRIDVHPAWLQLVEVGKA